MDDLEYKAYLQGVNDATNHAFYFKGVHVGFLFRPSKSSVGEYSVALFKGVEINYITGEITDKRGVA